MAKLLTRIVEDRFEDDFGVTIHNVHSREECVGPNCVIHNPSDHHMRDWPLSWKVDRKIFERICSHEVGHPDPDDNWYQINILGLTHSGVHGCDSCCHPIYSVNNNGKTNT